MRQKASKCSFCFLQRNLPISCEKEPSLDFLAVVLSNRSGRLGQTGCLHVDPSKSNFFRIGNRRKLKRPSQSFYHDCRCTLAYIYVVIFIFITRTLRCYKLQKTFLGTRSCTVDWLFDKVWLHINIQLFNILLHLLIITFFFFFKVSLHVKANPFWCNSRSSWSQVALILNKFNM